MRVLVVEDARTLADALVEGLQDEGMAVDVAYDGLQAAAKLELAGYDVVVLDRDLPGLHGDTICRMITERENPAMVLMLTASATPAERVSGLQPRSGRLPLQAVPLPRARAPRPRARPPPPDRPGEDLPGGRDRARPAAPQRHPRRTPARPRSARVRAP